MFVDTHLHVADSQFDADRPVVIERALAAGVKVLIEIAESPATWDAAIRLADQFPFVYVSLGIHPHHAHEAGPEVWPSLEKRLHELLRHSKVMAVGEFGLDYFRMQNTRDQQLYLFERQLELAREFQKPIVIHCREDAKVGEFSAHRDVQSALIRYYPEEHLTHTLERPNGVIHCFSGTWEDAQAYMKRGFLLGIDGPVTYPSAKLLKETVTRMPIQRMVLETDSPYLPPQTHRGQRNEPSYIPAIATIIGELQHKGTADVERQTTINAQALFRLPDSN